MTRTAVEEVVVPLLLVLVLVVVLALLFAVGASAAIQVCRMSSNFSRRATTWSTAIEMPRSSFASACDERIVKIVKLGT